MKESDYDYYKRIAEGSESLLHEAYTALKENMIFDEDSGVGTDLCRYCQEEVNIHCAECILIKLRSYFSE